MTQAKQSNTQFSSEGFDLDALQDAADNVVLELTHDGKGQKVVEPAAAAPEQPTTSSKQPELPENTSSAAPKVDEMQKADECKQQGNQAFQKGDFDGAFECYSQAIAATPGHPTGPELLELQEEWQKEQNAKARRRLQQQDEERRNKKATAESSSTVSSADASSKEESEKEETFRPPRHQHGAKLAIYYNNRAAAVMQQHQEQVGGAAAPMDGNNNDLHNDNDILENSHNSKLRDALQDCDIAILLDASYGKAWLRRATIHERLQKTDLALADAKQALELAVAIVPG